MIFAAAIFLILAAGASAQHQIKLKNSPTPLAGLILGADGRNVQLKTAAGQVGYPIAAIETVSMPAPPETAAYQKAMTDGDNAKALEIARAISEKYKGLPADWAKLAAASMANLLINTGDFDKAEAAFKEIEVLYPGAGGTQSKVGLARIAVEKKDFASAREVLAPIAEEALKEKNVSRENTFAYSQAFYALGMAHEGEGKLQDALENYLRTVTIFYHDPAARAAARQRAASLREKNKDKPSSEHITAP